MASALHLDEAWFSASAPLDRLLHCLFAELQPSQEDHLQRCQVVDRLNSVLADTNICPPGSTVLPFGSFESNLYTPWGDLDVALELPSESPLHRDYANRRLLARIARTLAHGQTPMAVRMQVVAHARIPLIMFHDKATGIACDLSINNGKGLLKSRVLKWVTELDPRCRQLIFLMIVPPILPPLSSILPKDSSDVSVEKGVPLNIEHFFGHCKQALSEWKLHSGAASNETSLATLFATFFLRVVDPFDLVENCARSVQANHFPRVIHAFSSAATALGRPPPLEGHRLQELQKFLFKWPTRPVRELTRLRHEPAGCVSHGTDNPRHTLAAPYSRHSQDAGETADVPHRRSLEQLLPAGASTSSVGIVWSGQRQVVGPRATQVVPLKPQATVGGIQGPSASGREGSWWRQPHNNGGTSLDQRQQHQWRGVDEIRTPPVQDGPWSRHEHSIPAATSQVGHDHVSASMLNITRPMQALPHSPSAHPDSQLPPALPKGHLPARVVELSTARPGEHKVAQPLQAGSYPADVASLTSGINLLALLLPKEAQRLQGARELSPQATIQNELNADSMKEDGDHNQKGVLPARKGSGPTRGQMRGQGRYHRPRRGSEVGLDTGLSATGASASGASTYPEASPQPFNADEQRQRVAGDGEACSQEGQSAERKGLEQPVEKRRGQGRARYSRSKGEVKAGANVGSKETGSRDSGPSDQAVGPSSGGRGGRRRVVINAVGMPPPTANSMQTEWAGT
eukprot:SM000018S03560  [mRNA]  locus=s18:29177:33026:+ [translate_table: standard]